MLDLVIEVEPFRLETEQAFRARLATIVIAAILIAPSPGEALAPAMLLEDRARGLHDCCAVHDANRR
jgi:hypothetical protein